MADLKRVADFTAPKDGPSGVELRRQLKNFESNVSNMGEHLRKGAMQRLDVVEREQKENGLLLAPGSAAGFDTSAGDVYLALAKPTAADQGTFVYLWSPNQANHFVISVAAGAKINGVDQTTIALATRFTVLIFCDGTGYWVD